MRAPDYISDDGTVTLYRGDCLEIMPGLPPVASCVTDPPYGLSSGKAKYLGDAGARGGFMGKAWDHGVPGVEFWQALNLLPGGALLAFGGCRTYHRMVCAIEDAGFQICNQLAWMFGSGFPKSKDISKAIDGAAGVEREVVGNGPYASRRPNADDGSNQVAYNHAKDGHIKPPGQSITAPATEAAKQWNGWFGGLQNLKPAMEPICYAQAPIVQTYAANAIEHGVAGLWIDGGRVGTGKDKGAGGGGVRQERQGKEMSSYSGGYIRTGINYAQGRWPANVLLDDVAAAMLDAQSGERPSKMGGSSPATGFWGNAGGCNGERRNDFGGASRFFKQFGWGPDDAPEIERFCYCAKASRKERNAGLEREAFTQPVGMPTSTHPTVKPVALMRYLCRITKTPTGGTIIDPFMGSGTTGAAAVKEGRPFIGIETDPESFDIAVRRIAHAIAERDAELPLEFAENEE